MKRDAHFCERPTCNSLGENVNITKKERLQILPVTNEEISKVKLILSVPN
jgi:hypothetical protein